MKDYTYLLNKEFIRKYVKSINFTPGFRKVFSDYIEVKLIPEKRRWWGGLRKRKLILIDGCIEEYEFYDNDIDEILSGKKDVNLGWTTGNIEKDDKGNYIFITKPHICICYKNNQSDKIFADTEELEKLVEIIKNEFEFIELEIEKVQ